MKQATKLNQVMLLIKSLSKAEKRYIRLYTNLQNGDKHYMVLYDLACEGFSAEQIYEKFCGKVNEKSFEIAAKHLYRVLLDCLVQLREKQDIQTTIFNYITKAGILFERELFDNALAELEKAKKLEPEDYLSHFRAITMATEAIGSREAVPVLLAMLTTSGVRGHSILSFAEARSNAVPDLNDTSTRNLALKELHLARALYLCGDQDGIGEEVLRRYADGLQGHYARYAQEILNSK